MTHPTPSSPRKFFFSAFGVLALGGVLGLSANSAYNFLPPDTPLAAVLSATSTPPEPEEPRTVHVPTPKPLKAIYMSQCVVGTPSFRDSLVGFVDDTELNAIVIDIRDFTGKIAFPTDNPVLAGMVSDECGAQDMKAFIERLHEKNIYVIGRITTFQNPYYTSLHPDEAVQKKSGGVWKDHKGLAFVDVGAKPYWKTVVELAKESYDIGFDEINFDYIRFPSDGNMAEADYTWSRGKTKAAALEEFYKYLSDELRSTGAVLSADLFGYVTVHENDLGIGQILELALPYFDYIYPMVYPSHYNDGFAGIADPNDDPYAVVYKSMAGAVARERATTTKFASLAYTPITKEEIVPATPGAATTTKVVETGLYKKPVYSGKVIPWLQSFDYPVDYTPAMVSAQIKASEAAGVEGWIFWDAANKYYSLRSVLTETATTQ